MKFLKELAVMSEGQMKEKMMDIIEKAINASDVEGTTYAQALQAIAKKVHSIDKSELFTGISDSELKDYIKGLYDEGDHDSINEAVVMEKRDIKAAAIGYATAWLKANFKKFSLPLKVKRIPTSGQYIMMTTVTSEDGSKTKNIFVKVVGDEAKQASSAQWPLEEDDMAGGSGSLDNQQQGGIPQGATEPNAPQGTQAATPAPDDAAKPDEPAPNKVISKAGTFRVELGANEQVSIIDGKGNIRLSMPMVVWKELARQ